MNFIEKVRYLKMRQEKRDYDREECFIDMSVEQNYWQPNELEEIVMAYPYVPKEYIEFIKEFDNLGLSFTTFYGSKHIETYGLNPIWSVGLVDYINELLEYTDIFKYEYFPFGKDSAGSVFAFNKKQEVVCFDIDDYEFKNPEKIANNFEEFVDECLTGKRIGEFLSETSGYYKFLKSLGWV